jgi:hypothetical protein
MLHVLQTTASDRNSVPWNFPNWTARRHRNVTCLRKTCVSPLSMYKREFIREPVGIESWRHGTRRVKQAKRPLIRANHTKHVNQSIRWLVCCIVHGHSVYLRFGEANIFKNSKTNLKKYSVSVVLLNVFIKQSDNLFHSLFKTFNLALTQKHLHRNVFGYGLNRRIFTRKTKQSPFFYLF